MSRTMFAYRIARIIWLARRYMTMRLAFKVAALAVLAYQAHKEDSPTYRMHIGAMRSALLKAKAARLA